MRLGGPVFEFSGPDDWVKLHKKNGYRAAYCPLAGDTGDESLVKAYRQAAGKADLVIAEVGAWSNPISPDGKMRRDALEKCKKALHMAELIGAECCVNITGSRGKGWADPHPHNLTKDTFDLVVQSIREIIDAVKPSNTFYTAEAMPWLIPDSADSYLALLKAVDREKFAVHYDPANLINSPGKYYNNAAMYGEFVKKLGKWIKSCHLKDIILQPSMTTHLDETRPGLGYMDHAVLLRVLDGLHKDLPVMMEHLPDQVQYGLAAGHVRGLASREKISI